MRNILSILLVIAVTTAQAQKTYFAIYKYYFPADVVAASQEWQEKYPDRQHTSTDDSISADPAFKKMENEARKVIQNKQQMQCILSPVAMRSESIEIGSKTMHMPNGGGVVSHQIGSGYSITNYNNWLDVCYQELQGIKDTTCQLIDTSKLHFVKTGLKKKVGQWNCVAYKPALPGYDDITYWVCPSLKNYIHPSMFMGIGIDGGVVKVEFKKNKGSITLVSVTDTTAVIPVQPCPHNTPPKLFNPLGGGLREY